MSRLMMRRRGVPAVSEVTVGAYNGVVLADTPYFYWGLNTNPLLPNVDSSGNDRLLTSQTSVTPAQPPLVGSGYSVNLPAPNSQLNFAGLLVGQQEQTVEFWFKPTQITAGSLFEVGAASSGFQVVMLGTGVIQVYHASSDIILTSTTALVAGSTYHIVAVSSGLNGAVRLYINGVEEDAFTGSVGNTTSSAEGAFGAANGTNVPGSGTPGATVLTTAAMGYYDEIAVYTYELPANRVATHYTIGGTYPNAATTGHTSPIEDLTVYNGTYNVNTVGAVVEGMLINGRLNINADNVIVRDTLVRPSGSTFGIDVADGVRGVLLEDVTVEGPPDGSCSAGIVGEGFTSLRNNVYGSVDGWKVSHSTAIIDSWCHDLYKVEGVTHTDCVQSTGGTDIVIRGNRFEGPWQLATSAMKLDAANRPLTGLVVEDNLFSGGTYTIYLGYSDGSQPPPQDHIFRDNVWVKDSYKWQPTSVDPDINFAEWSNNRLDDGTLIPEP